MPLACCSSYLCLSIYTHATITLWELIEDLDLCALAISSTVLLATTLLGKKCLQVIFFLPHFFSFASWSFFSDFLIFEIGIFTWRIYSQYQSLLPGVTLKSVFGVYYTFVYNEFRVPVELFLGTQQHKANFSTLSLSNYRYYFLVVCDGQYLVSLFGAD